MDEIRNLKFPILHRTAWTREWFSTRTCPSPGRCCIWSCDMDSKYSDVYLYEHLISVIKITNETLGWTSVKCNWWYHIWCSADFLNKNIEEIWWISRARFACKNVWYREWRGWQEASRGRRFRQRRRYSRQSLHIFYVVLVRYLRMYYGTFLRNRCYEMYRIRPIQYRYINAGICLLFSSQWKTIFENL